MALGKLFFFSKTTLPRLLEFGFIPKNGFWKLLSIRDLSKFNSKLRPSEKSKFFDISPELPSEIQIFGFNRNYSLREFPLHEFLRIIFFTQKAMILGNNKFCQMSNLLKPDHRFNRSSSLLKDCLYNFLRPIFF